MNEGKNDLKEFEVERDLDDVRVNMVSRKLLSEVPPKEKKNLNSQDLADLREI